MKAVNRFYDIRRTGYLAKIEESKMNIADRIQAKIDINSEHSQELQTSLDELSSNKKRVEGELEKLTTHFRELDRMTGKTDSSGARRSAVSLMRQIGPKINGLEEELISCNKDEGKILKRKAKIDAKLEKNDEQLGDLGVSPREKNKTKKTSEFEVEKGIDKSIVPTPLSNLENTVGEMGEPINGYQSKNETKEDRPVYFEDSLDEGVQERPIPKQEKKEVKEKISIEKAIITWNKEFPEFPLTEGSYYAIRSTKYNRDQMRSAVTNLMNKQHPFSPRMVKTIVKTGLDIIYKNK
ncbi:MAG: hypothetical protein EXS49_00615 [Candidatus Pacebacteria bacterium]|nr:hypothetical protein [Candidatus Paceibacterota bacterium]